MSYEEAAMKALVEGVRDGQKESLAEAPYFKTTLGIEPDTHTLSRIPTRISLLPEGVLGVTHIHPEGRALGMEISPYIAQTATKVAKAYNRSKEWLGRVVYRWAKDVTKHESYHVMSAPLAKGEEVDDNARDIMESITTRGRYKVALAKGNQSEAELIKDTNPYPKAWKISELADWAPYEGPSGKGYAGFLRDASQEKFYMPRWRLAKQAVKAAITRGKEAVGLSYAPLAA